MLILSIGIPPLVALIKTGDDAAKENATLAIRNLAAIVENKSKIARCNEAIPALIELISSSEVDMKCKEHAAGALGNLAVNSKNKVIISHSGGKTIVSNPMQSSF